MTTPPQQRHDLPIRLFSDTWFARVWLALMRMLLITCKCVMVIGFLNVLLFMAILLVLGGDAVNGGTSDGHYYLGAHGHRTEVSHGVWVYSRCHAYSAMILTPAAMIAGITAGLIKKMYPAVEPDMPD